MPLQDRAPAPGDNADDFNHTVREMVIRSASIATSEAFGMPARSISHTSSDLRTIRFHVGSFRAVVIPGRPLLLLGKAFQFENQIRDDGNIDRQGEASSNAHPPGQLIDFDRQQR